jgi:hypothetical protein
VLLDLLLLAMGAAGLLLLLAMGAAAGHGRCCWSAAWGARPGPSARRGCPRPRHQWSAAQEENAQPRPRWSAPQEQDAQGRRTRRNGILAS